jgi:hypothetical protein
VEKNSPLPKNHWYLKSPGRAMIVLRVAVFALCLLCIWLPRVGTPLLAITPPFAYFSNEYLYYFARWSHTQFELNVYWIGVVITFAAVLTFRRALFLIIAIMSFLFTLPYLLPLTATFDVAKYVPATSITRYSVYFLPLAMCLLIHFWEQAFKFLESLLPRFQSVVQLLIPAVLGLVLLVGQLGPMEQRSLDYRSITPVVCSLDRFSVPSQSGDHFMKGYMNMYVADPLEVLYDDYRIKRRSDLVFRVLDIKNLDTTCNYPVNALLEALGPWVGGDSQARFDRIKELLGSQSENELREDVFDVYRLMKSRGEI